MPRPVAKWNREVVCYFISFLHQPQNCPVAPPPPPPPPPHSVFRSSRVEDELLRGCFHTQMIGLNFFFFFLFRPHPNIAPVSHRAQLSSSTCRQQTRGGALSEHRPGNGHTVGGPVAPRMSARFESAAQSGQANRPVFFPVAPRRPEHSGAVMQAVATTSFCVFAFA